MEQIELRAETRSLFGKKTKRLRRSGLIPGILYGHLSDPIPLQANERDLGLALDRAGTNHLITLWIEDAEQPRMTLAREVQRDVITHSLLHVDLYEVVMTEKIRAEIPISLVGESPIVEQKGSVLVRGVDSVEVQCFPGELVESIKVDVSVLEEEEQSILVKDLALDEAMEILTDPDEVVVKVLTVRAPLIEEVVEEEVELAELEVATAAREREEEPEEEWPEPGAEESAQQA